ncbi:accessory gland-specific peptide 26Aa [Drosophila mauritiana]|uniref:Accessory gland-specific peptide 26Aa n=2 Tax=Drosophila mauritiana TaxID=7226 RepID=A0A6P8LE73_DROMA|nr:accessory gland-specific peptide 26Aa [Drosophila mauritiana]
MNQILLCSQILLLFFTVANCDGEHQLDSSVDLKSDSTKSAILKNFAHKNDATQAGKKGDYVMDIDVSDMPLDDYPINNSKSRKNSSTLPSPILTDKLNQGSNQIALKALKHRLVMEQNNNLFLRNHSVSLMNEIEARKTDIIQARQLNIDLELELESLKRKLSEMNVQNARKSTKSCKKRPSKDIAPPANQLQEVIVKNTYRNKYLTLLTQLAQKINYEIANVNNPATDVPTGKSPSEGNPSTT